MAVKPGLQTIEDLLALPDDGKRYELRNGVIVEVGTSSFKHALLGSWFIVMLTNYIKTHQIGGRVTGADGTYQLDDLNTKVPDAAYISPQKVATLSDETVYCPFAPDLVVEIKSPSQSEDEMHKLALLYLRTGARLVWTVDYKTKIVKVYRAGHKPFDVQGSGELDGYDVLPGLKLSLVEMFAEIEIN